MDAEELDVLDVLAYNSDALLNDFHCQTNDVQKINIIKTYLKEHYESKLDGVCDFQKDLDWFNVTEPIRMAQLNGKLVVLDFFTYCCVNCLHILPDLKSIEQTHSVENGLVVIGVHSAKFDNEKDSANLLSAIQRYNITHPVVNDFSLCIWEQLKIKCWPTLFIISPSGVPLFVLMGEGHGLFLNKFIDTAINFYNARGELNNLTLPLSPSTDLICASNLRFPGKICCRFLVKEQCDLIAVSDSGNNRILLLNSQGQVLEKIGGFESGFIDGDFKTAKFNSPQGITFFSDNELIVADKENHAIRKICLTEHCVSTIAGTGKHGSDKCGGQVGIKQPLSSPWDVAVYKTLDMDMSFHMDEKSVPEKNVILIAMSGTHQIWGLFLDGIIWWKFKKYEPLTCAAIIGNGSEENRNNSYPQNAAFAQPSGLSLYKDMLYIADSESSSIRKVSLIDGKVTAVVGGDRNPLNLFAFGDTDGKQFSAKLQHPLGVVCNPSDGYLYVADTYNHKIKRIDTTSNVVETCCIRDKNTNEVFHFSEPDGVCVDTSGRLLYVADTNNHSIRVVELKTMLTWQLDLKFNKNSSYDREDNLKADSEKIIKINTEARLVVNVALSCISGVQLTHNAPQKWNLELPDKGFTAEQTSGQITGGKFVIILKVNYNEAVEKYLKLKCNLNVCTGNVCMHTEFRTQMKFIYDAEANSNVVENLTYSVHPDSVCLL